MKKTMSDAQLTAQAGSRLLFHAIKKNVERVERRYRNTKTRERCSQMANLCDEALRMIEEGKEFAVFLSWQPSLPDYETTDDAYALDDPPLVEDRWNEIKPF